MTFLFRTVLAWTHTAMLPLLVAGLGCGSERAALPPDTSGDPDAAPRSDEPGEADAGVMEEPDASEPDAGQEVSEDAGAAEDAEVIDGDPVVRLAITVHLEGWNVRDEEIFGRYVDLIRDRAALFGRYGVPLSFESNEATAGALLWDENILLEVREAGHGVSIHADLGGQSDPSYTTEEMTEGLLEHVENQDELGLDPIGVSGICSEVDWVTAAINAGMRFASGAVAYCLQSLPYEERPEEFADCENARDCHDPYPQTLAERLHPWRMRDGASWLEHDEAGQLVMLPTSGAIPCLYESETSSSETSCAFDENDIATYLEHLEEVLALAEPGEINVMINAWSFGNAQNPDVFEALLEAVQPYVEDGRVVWNTTEEIYEAYLAAEE